MNSGERRWRADVFVSLKPAVNDPQGLAIRDGLHNLGYGEVESVRAGKYIQLWVEAPDAETAGRRIDAMCHQLLANPVIEQYTFTINEPSAAAV